MIVAKVDLTAGTEGARPVVNIEVWDDLPDSTETVEYVEASAEVGTSWTWDGADLQPPTPDVTELYDSIILQIGAMELAMKGRVFTWYPGVADIPLLLSEEFLNKLHRQAFNLERKQIGYHPWTSDPASFTGSIAGDILDVSAWTDGSLGIGSIIAGTGVTAGTRVTAVLGDDKFVVTPSQTAASTAMTSGNAFLGPWVSGDGAPLKVRDANGAYFEIDANNLRDMDTDAFRAEYLIAQQASDFTDSADAAFALHPGDTAAAIAGLNAVSLLIADEDNWPDTDLPLP